MATRQATPSNNLTVLNPANSLKRVLSEDPDSDSLPDQKKPKLTVSENNPQAKDKKKRKKKKKKTPVVVPLDLPPGILSAPVDPMGIGKGKRKAMSAPPASQEQVVEIEPETQETEGEPLMAQAVDSETSLQTIARLKEELNAQSALLKKHEAALAQLNNSLTCQICLDFLYKPYALAPCGHIACYNCIVSWFTREPEENTFGHPRKKTCPHCRATIKERPVEVWSIKEMVSALLKSGLTSRPNTPAPTPALPGPPQREDGTPRDPWHNIFRYPHQHPMFHPPPAVGGEPPSIEDMGMLDAEDGGVYRCLDCMHEIWDGVCTSCQRVYPGHQVDGDVDGDMFEFDDDDDESDGDEGPMFWPPFPHMHAVDLNYDGPMLPLPFHAHAWFHQDDEDEDEDMHDHEDGYDSFIDDGDDDEDEEEHQAAAIMGINDWDEDDSNSERRATTSSPPPVALRRRAPVTFISSDDEDEDDCTPQPRRANRRSPTVESEVIVVSDDTDEDDNHGGAPRRGRRSRFQHLSEDEVEDGDEDEEHTREYGLTRDPSEDDYDSGVGSGLEYNYMRFEDRDGSGSASGSGSDDEGW